jgi:thiol-disulfide isomerase/thioredoxin
VSRAAQLVTGLTVVVLAAIGGAIVHRALAPQLSVRVQSAAERAAALPQAPAEADLAPKVPIAMTVPDLALPDTAGKSHQLSDWTGHPVIFNFWATWCDPCRREIPLLIRLRHERSATGLEVVGIAVDFRAAVADYARHAGIDYPVLVGEDKGLEAVKAFGMELLLPFSVFADDRGRVVAVKLGELHPDEASFILDRVQEVDHGTLTLDAARQQIAAKSKDFAIERAKHA